MAENSAFTWAYAHGRTFIRTTKFPGDSCKTGYRKRKHVGSGH